MERWKPGRQLRRRTHDCATQMNRMNHRLDKKCSVQRDVPGITACHGINSVLVRHAGAFQTFLPFHCAAP